MLRTLDMIWLGLFLFGACTVQTYQPPLGIELDGDVDIEVRVVTTQEEELLNENQRATYRTDEVSEKEDEDDNDRRLKN